MTPRVSILVPTYERRDVVGGAVTSALGQTFQDLEVVVVDDGSTDGTLEALSHAFDDPRLVCVAQENAGTASARNHGLALARGEFVGFLDSDDRYQPSFVERMVAALDAAACADLALCDVAYVGETRRGWTTLRARQRPPRSIDDMLWGGWWLPAGILARTSAARAIAFDERAYIEDTDFLFRFFAAGHRSVFVPEVLADYVVAAAGGAPQKSSAEMLQRRAMLDLQERYAPLASRPGAHRAWLERRWARYHLRCGRRAEARVRALRGWKGRPWSVGAIHCLIRTYLPC